MKKNYAVSLIIYLILFHSFLSVTAQGIYQLWGCTAKGGVYSSGVLFTTKYNGTGQNIKKTFTNSNEFNPGGSLIYYDKKIYGFTTKGGLNAAGIIYEYDFATSKYSPKKHFPVELFGKNIDWILYNTKFYGIASVSNGGILFEYDPVADSYTKRYSFNIFSGTYPSTKLAVAGGKLYGTCAGGYADANLSTIFEYNPVDFKVTVVASGTYQFNTNLTLCNAKLYTVGYKNDNAYILEYNPATKIFLQKKIFPSNLIGPRGALTAFNNNRLYGICFGNEEYTTSALYEYDPANSNLTKQLDLPLLNPASYTDMTLQNGMFYKMVQKGSNSLPGGISEIIFEYDQVEKKFNVTHTFNALNGKAISNCQLTPAPAAVAKGSNLFCSNSNEVTINAANKNNSKWVPFTDGAGNAIAEINANGNDLGKVSVSFYIHNGAIRTNNSQYYLNRNTRFNLEKKPISPVNIRVYIRKAEVDAMISTPASQVTKFEDLAIFANNDPCGSKIQSIAGITPGTSAAWGGDYVFSLGATQNFTYYFASKNYTSFTGNGLPLTGDNTDNFKKQMETNNHTVNITPNPVHNVATLEIRSPEAKNLQIAISDINSRIVLTKTIAVSAGTNISRLDLSSLDNGIFQISYLDNDGKRASIKFIKQ